MTVALCSALSSHLFGSSVSESEESIYVDVTLATCVLSGYLKICHPSPHSTPVWVLLCYITDSSL